MVRRIATLRFHFQLLKELAWKGFGSQRALPLAGLTQIILAVHNCPVGGGLTKKRGWEPLLGEKGWNLKGGSEVFSKVSPHLVDKGGQQCLRELSFAPGVDTKQGGVFGRLILLPPTS